MTNNLPARVKFLQKYLDELQTTSYRKSVLLLMLTQAEGIVREIKQDLGHIPPEPTYEPKTPEHLEKYTFKAKTCCGKTFHSPQSWAGHLNSSKHRKKDEDKKRPNSK
jgi:hypothetical protein